MTVWVWDTSWYKLNKPRKCRHLLPGRKPCGKPAEYGLDRKTVVFAYCTEHMYGRRIREGIVEVEVEADSPAAQKGYV